MSKLPLRHIGRYAQIAKLLYKYGHGDVVEQSGLSSTLNGHSKNGNGDAAPSHDWKADGDGSEQQKGGSPPPEEFARDLEGLGPTFIKLGQLLSTRPDFVSEPYRQALDKLQDDNEPIAAREIFRLVETELGQQPEHLFESFDVEPLATASLGQVHRARMAGGQEVVVKVQRPDIAQVLSDDIEAMEELVGLCKTLGVARDFQLGHMVESLKQSLAAEIDYENESRNAKTLKHNLEEFENIIVPQPVDSRTTARVITSEYIESEKITEISPARLSGIDGKQLASDLFSSFLHQVLVHGAFHADPHPGNIALTNDNRIVLMDFGLVVKVPPRLQAELIKLLLAICEGDGTRAAVLAENAGVVGERFEREKFQREIERVVSENVDQSVDQMKAGAALMQIQKAAGENDLQLPREVILLGRALMQLERVVSSLDPDFRPNEVIREQTMEIMREHSGKQVTLTSLYQSLLEATEFAQRLPSRANKFAEMLANNELRVKVDSIDENKLITGLNKVANRISAGLIIAAMIIGAALMMRLETSWTILGYPAIAFCFLTLAAVAGGILVWRVVVSDNFR